MKGHLKITVEHTEQTGAFPIKHTYTFDVDNTPECIDDIVPMLRKILHCLDFHSDTINEVFNDEV